MKEVEKSGVDFLVFEKLEGMRDLRHGVSRRRQRGEGSVGNGVGEEFNFSLDDPERAARARERFCRALGFSDEPVVRPQQVHGVRVAVVRAPGEVVGRADAVCTRVKGAPMMLVGADGPLILIYEPSGAAVGLAHAGRRGTAQKIVDRLIRRMMDEFGCDPKQMIVGIGPGICGKCYQVGAEVVDEFKRQFEDVSGFIREGCRQEGGITECGRDARGTRQDTGGANKWYLDLNRANREQLIGAGIPVENIEESNCCTFEQGDWFYSYRREGERTGRHALLAGLSD